MNNLTIKDQTREQIAEFLPEALRTALNSYQNFTSAGPKEDNSDFKEHHVSCKAAIAHIELLIKLANWADIPQGKLEDKNQQAVVCSMLEEAEQELIGREDLIVEYERVQEE